MTFLDWARELPDQWKAKPLRSVADCIVSNVDKLSLNDEAQVRLCNYTDVYHNEFITLGLDFMSATASEHEIEKFGLSKGDVIITKDSETWDDIGIPALVRETADDLVCGYHLALLRPRKTIMDSAFLFRCLQAKPIRLQLELSARGVTRFGLSKSEIGAIALPIPLLPHQSIIADYLDRETARLDALVTAKERVLELLTERRQALIAAAVTGGIEPNVRHRNFGVPWLGEIPTHWKLGRLKDFGSLLAGAGFPHEFQGVLGETLPFYKVGDLAMSRDNQGMGKPSNTVSYKTAVRLRAHIVPAGAIVYAKIGAALLLNRRRIATVPCVIDNNMTAYIPYKEKLTSKWAFYWTSILDFGMFANPGAVPSLSEGAQAQLPIAIPSIAEQRVIADYLDCETARLDALKVKIQGTIALLKERRAAVIAAAVTGQIDVESAV